MTGIKPMNDLAAGSSRHGTHPDESHSAPPFHSVQGEDADRDSAIIVVEDEPDDFVLLERAFRKVDRVGQVCWAQTGAQALELLNLLGMRAGQIVVVADVQLPGMDGFELLQEIQGRSTAARIRFVFLTGRRDDRTEARARALGVDGYFVKPNRSEDLVLIASALRGMATTQCSTITTNSESRG